MNNPEKKTFIILFDSGLKKIFKIFLWKGLILRSIPQKGNYKNIYNENYSAFYSSNHTAHKTYSKSEFAGQHFNNYFSTTLVPEFLHQGTVNSNNTGLGVVTM